MGKSKSWRNRTLSWIDLADFLSVDQQPRHAFVNHPDQRGEGLHLERRACSTLDEHVHGEVWTRVRTYDEEQIARRKVMLEAFEKPRRELLSEEGDV